MFLTRSLKHAKLFRAGTTPQAIELFVSARYEVVAGVKQAMQQFAAGNQAVRMIPEPFMEIHQAMCTPAGRDAASAYLATFVETIKANGSSRRRWPGTVKPTLGLRRGHSPHDEHGA